MLAPFPPYSIRRSRRSRFASLKISPSRGLEIILPMRYPLTAVPNLLIEKRDWIEQNAGLLRQFAQRQNPELPQEVDLPGLGEVWQINYLFSPAKMQVIMAPEHKLTVLGNIDDKPACLAVLRDWLRHKAERFLAPQLYDLSRELGLPFQGLCIRGQKTRWGSCSANKTINLNFKLILLPLEIIRHILLHELCHTIHLNHSPKFWQLMACHDSNWRSHHHLSRTIGGQLPAWVDK